MPLTSPLLAVRPQARDGGSFDYKFSYFWFDLRLRYSRWGKMKHARTKVVVAGAGPVGSVAAYFLAQRNIDVILIESGRTSAEDLRASTFHPPTL